MKLELTPFPLDSEHELLIGQLPAELVPGPEEFEKLWSLHPEHFDFLTTRRGPVKLPRWQQNYGRAYYYTGQQYPAKPIPESIKAFLESCQSTIDQRFNGVLLNWYDGKRGHYIGRHRDNVRDLIAGVPIVTISLGEERIFRMRPQAHGGVGAGMKDIPARSGSVFVLPFATNRVWFHEVPHFKRYRGRRISITLRAFIDR